MPAKASAIALENSSEGVLIADMRMRGQPIVQVNPAFEFDHWLRCSRGDWEKLPLSSGQ